MDPVCLTSSKYAIDCLAKSMWDCNSDSFSEKTNNKKIYILDGKKKKKRTRKNRKLQRPNQGQ